MYRHRGKTEWRARRTSPGPFIPVIHTAALCSVDPAAGLGAEALAHAALCLLLMLSPVSAPSAAARTPVLTRPTTCMAQQHGRAASAACWPQQRSAGRRQAGCSRPWAWGHTQTARQAKQQTQASPAPPHNRGPGCALAVSATHACLCHGHHPLLLRPPLLRECLQPDDEGVRVGGGRGGGGRVLAQVGEVVLGEVHAVLAGGGRAALGWGEVLLHLRGARARACPSQ